ncbi:hypothetical protein DFS34DRAFT_114145 [Phlyctochytrium arcticum]|nr:hypothetical protein DFS34DRAFT_114145 [Phlyctochytrium arcticum]
MSILIDNLILLWNSQGTFNYLYLVAGGLLLWEALQYIAFVIWSRRYRWNLAILTSTMLFGGITLWCQILLNFKGNSYLYAIYYLLTHFATLYFLAIKMEVVQRLKSRLWFTVACRVTSGLLVVAILADFAIRVRWAYSIDTATQSRAEFRGTVKYAFYNSILASGIAVVTSIMSISFLVSVRTMFLHRNLLREVNVVPNQFIKISLAILLSIASIFMAAFGTNILHYYNAQSFANIVIGLHYSVIVNDFTSFLSCMAGATAEELKALQDTMSSLERGGSRERVAKGSWGSLGSDRTHPSTKSPNSPRPVRTPLKKNEPVYDTYFKK